jgi:hypothetical protein
MKLYNLYQNIILEEIIKMMQLNEAVSPNDIDSVLNGDPNRQGKFYHVSFDYKDNDGNVSNRWVQIFQKNISTANNGLIDAFQVSRDGNTSSPTNEEHSPTGWKKFRLDRMNNFKVSKVPFTQEPKPYVSGYRADGTARTAKLNKTGNNSPTVSSTQKIAKIGSFQYADSTKANKERQKQRAEKDTQARLQQQKQNFGGRQQPTTQPTQQQQQQQPVQQQQKPLAQKPVVQKPIKQPNPVVDKDLENKDELNK